LVNVHANILFLIHDGAPFARVGDSNNHNLSQKWAPFYIACNRGYYANHRRDLSLGAGRSRVAVALPRWPEEKKKQARQW
ncbi:MAG: hypothetical protein WBW02_09210, partial [Candidatus Sulfotelmatobacter sp.]